MREISPAVGMSSDDYLKIAHPLQQQFADEIRRQKQEGLLRLPSSTLIDSSNILSSGARKELIDKVASLVDESLFGRSDMCQQFSMLLALSLNHLGIYAKTIYGKASYANNFSWQHYWVETKDEIIDANTDSMVENPAVPNSIDPKPYWGVKKSLPPDRTLKSKRDAKIPKDPDVSNIWWPELKSWLTQHNNYKQRDCQTLRVCQPLL